MNIMPSSQVKYHTIMGKCVYLLIFFYVPGLHFLSASAVVHLVQAGQNASLSCNLTNSREIIWFQMRSEELVTLITVTWNSHFLNTAEVIKEDTDHFDTKENNSLEIIVVTEADLGLYYCAGRYNGKVRFGKGIRLTFTETWLAWDMLSESVQPTGFSVLHADKNKHLSGKKKGGGVCFMINDS
ncbi:uncharacterized protein LOC118399323 isoform X3 [Oncorhynchus keta]|uniref:uncharacterized protein LOC118399323 isoform X3 n=1 Tax=Oncorhynchus keta TaxID=8018 RepID=UPI00227BF73E|nr:uncharacterized protein LOC118399323 isoform X3 [Oncorhynchus keta]